MRIDIDLNRLRDLVEDRLRDILVTFGRKLTRLAGSPHSQLRALAGKTGETPVIGVLDARHLPSRSGTSLIVSLGDLLDLSGILHRETVGVDEIREDISARSVTPWPPFYRISMLFQSAGSIHQAIEARHIPSRMIDVTVTSAAIATEGWSALHRRKLIIAV